MQKALYIPGLDGMRAIAFLIVFVGHSMPYRNLPAGFGVTIFFFLSGYLITTLLRNEARHHRSISLKNFYLRRLLRIFPPCYVTILIVTALAAFRVLYNTESYWSLPSAFLYFSNYWNIFGFGNLPAGLGVLLVACGRGALLSPVSCVLRLVRVCRCQPQTPGNVSARAVHRRVAMAMLPGCRASFALGKHLRGN